MKMLIAICFHAITSIVFIEKNCWTHNNLGSKMARTCSIFLYILSYIR